MSIEFPIKVKNIKVDEFSNPFDCPCLSQESIGKFVAIRPCIEEYKDRTYLGLFLGCAVVTLDINYDSNNEELNIESGMGNPAIYVFDLKKIIFGYQSWWGKIKSEEELKKITNNDINDVWYIKALKQLGGKI